MYCHLGPLGLLESGDENPEQARIDPYNPTHKAFLQLMFDEAISRISTLEYKVSFLICVTIV